MTFNVIDMIDINKQITYWRDGAIEDWEVARELISSDRGRHGLFFAHLAIEKLVKAHICRSTKDLAPRIHNLVRLADIAELSLNQTQTDTMAEMNAFSVEGRYPDSFIEPVSYSEAKEYLSRAEEVYQWLMNQL